MMLNRQGKALSLLAIFLVGGLGAPLAHRFEHVQELLHLHGEPAPDFVRAAAPAPGYVHAELLVEERTPADELRCQLCARLTCKASLGSEAPLPPELRARLSDRLNATYTSQSFGLFSIRAPPTVA